VSSEGFAENAPWISQKPIIFLVQSALASLKINLPTLVRTIFFVIFALIIQIPAAVAVSFYQILQNAQTVKKFLYSYHCHIKKFSKCKHVAGCANAATFQIALTLFSVKTVISVKIMTLLRNMIARYVVIYQLLSCAKNALPYTPAKIACKKFILAKEFTAEHVEMKLLGGFVGAANRFWREMM
jgi:hypothetical protein